MFCRVTDRPHRLCRDDQEMAPIHKWVTLFILWQKHWNNFIPLLFRTDTSCSVVSFPQDNSSWWYWSPSDTTSKIHWSRESNNHFHLSQAVFVTTCSSSLSCTMVIFCLPPPQLVEPYSQHKANGYALFLVSSRAFLQLDQAVLPNSNCSSPWQAFDDGRLADKDTYFDHLELIEDPLKILLITSKWVTILFVAPSTSASSQEWGLISAWPGIAPFHGDLLH